MKRQNDDLTCSESHDHRFGLGVREMEDRYGRTSLGQTGNWNVD